MKKLITMAVLVAFATGCTATGTEEDYETEIQLIDKKDYENPRDKNRKKGDEDRSATGF